MCGNRTSESTLSTHPLHPLSAQDLPLIEAAPDFTGITNWINSKPLTIEDLHGKVVLVDFWTYSCINCIRTLPYLKSWYEKYKDKGLVIVGVHTPEFEFEKNPQNVIDAAKRFGILYPIAQDNNFKTWQAFQNQYWPAKYLIDQHGVVRFMHFGEGDYLGTENAIRLLLNEPPLADVEESKIGLPVTPETYLGYKRADRYAEDITVHPDESFEYSYKQPLKSNHVGIQGKWIVGPESITADGDSSTLELNFIAKEVYLVIGGKGGAISVLLDGAPIPKEDYTKDMSENGEIIIDGDRKYDIVSLKEYGRHTVTLKVPKGVSAYAFTFGD